MRVNGKGFTLIELIIVIVIIGILASVAAPMMRAVKVKAICGEAVTGMSAIRTALRSYYVEYNKYPSIPYNFLSKLPPEDVKKYLPGLDIDKLQGTYFGKECYAVLQGTIICCVDPPNCGGLGIPGQANSAVRYPETATIMDGSYKDGMLFMDPANGEIVQWHIKRSGYEQVVWV